MQAAALAQGAAAAEDRAMGLPRALFGTTVAVFLALAPAVAWAAGETMAGRSAAAAFVFSAQATQNAIVKAMDDDLLTQRRRTESLSAQLVSMRAQLATARATRSKSDLLQAELDQLNRDTAAAQEQFATALAQKDEAYARELAALHDATDTVLATPDGVHMLELANAGDWQGVKLLEVSIRAAQQKQHDLQDAAQARAYAVLAQDAADKGREQIGAVIDDYREVTKLDPSHYEDWLSLATLYRKANDLSNAGRAAAMAIQIATTDAEQADADLVDSDIDAAAGDHAGALAADRAAIDAIGRWLARDPAALDAHRLQIAALNLEGRTLQAQGDLQGAVTAFRQLGAVCLALLRSGHASEADLEYMVQPVAAVAQILLQIGRPADALDLARSQIATQRSFVANYPDDLKLRLDLAALLVIVGDALEAKKDLTGARAADEEALAIDQAVMAKDPSFVEARAAMSIDLDRVGRIQALQGDLAGAAAMFRQELTLRRALAADDPSSAEHPLAIVIADGELARVQMAAGDSADAASQEALQIARALLAKDPTSAMDRAVLADAVQRAAAVATRQTKAHP
jgi:tetratricopeptide (TPR) repeat protein